MNTKKFSFLFCLSATLIVTSGCSVAKEEVKRIPEDSVATDKENSSEETDQTSTTIESEYGKSVELQKLDSKVPLGKINTYDLSSFFKGHNVLVAPEYIYNDQIFYYNNKEKESFIYKYDTAKKQNKTVYTTNKPIGMLTGVQNYILWIEMEQPNEKGVKWSILQMNTDTDEVKKLDSGESLFNTSPPHIEGSTDHATWITHESDGKTTTSYLKSYSLKDMKLSTVDSFVLKEGEKRDGVYPFDYRESENGLLLHKSTFKEGKKIPTLETDNGVYKKTMNGLIDFKRGANYIALGQEGNAIFQNIDSKKDGLIYSTSEDLLTVDAFRFISKDKVVFREGMNQLFYADLSAKTVAPLTDYDNTTSKPIYNDGTLTYAVSDGADIKFKVIKTSLK